MLSYAFDDRKKIYEDYIIGQTIFASILLAHLKSLCYPFVNKYLSASVDLRSMCSLFSLGFQIDTKN